MPWGLTVEPLGETSKLTFQQEQRTQRIGLRKCQDCKMWVLHRSNHRSRCTATRLEETNQQIGSQDSTTGPQKLSQSDIEPGILTRIDAATALVLDNHTEWLDQLEWQDCTRYFRQTITVPPACKEKYQELMQIPLQCWDWKFHDFSIKLHYVIIICLSGAVAASSYSGTPSSLHGSIQGSH